LADNSDALSGCSLRGKLVAFHRRQEPTVHPVHAGERTGAADLPIAAECSVPQRASVIMPS